jgi:hypothetical protein
MALSVKVTYRRFKVPGKSILKICRRILPNPKMAEDDLPRLA